MTNLKKYNESIFESIKHTDEYGNEYWEARELQKVLKYKEWRNFDKVLQKAITACSLSNIKISEQFVDFNKPITGGNGNIQYVKDYKLSRYACYLMVQNADPNKEVVALGQTYFAVQTRKQELTESEYENLSEDEKRLYQRSRIRKGNYTLNITAKKLGVKNFDKFHNAGYKGLYNGETADDIAKRKELRYREDILDNMGSDELAANLFRISLANQKLNNEKINGEKNSCDAHFEVGKAVRDTIDKVGGTLPENLPTPDKSIKDLSKNDKIKFTEK